MQQDFQIPVFVEERAGLRRHREAVRLGIPLPRGLLREASGAVVVAADSGRSLEQQARALARWPDQSIKWLLLDVLASVGAHQRAALLVRPGDPVQDNRVASAVPLKIGEHGGTLLVDTGAACFELGGERGALLGAVRVGGASLLDGLGARIRLLDCSAREYAAFAAKAYVEEAGPVRAAVVLEGQLRRAGRTAALFKARFTFIVRATSLRLEFQLRNPRAASHRGGLWDLADRGTVRFEDLSLRMTPGAPATELRWCAESPEPMRSQRPSPWTLYQDSSGGESWDSDNHVDGTGSLSVAFRGYQVRTADGAGQTATTAGARATPYLCVSSGDGSIAVTAMDFWQNFPKALRWDGRTVSVGLFPGECRVPFALQGGEQKRHTLLLEFLPPDQETSIPALQHPLAAWVDPAWIEESGALGSFVTARRDPNDAYLRYVNAIVDGPHSFERKRELIDEYGWRNFGDLYADHEGVRHPGPRPLVSHYNNQYDFIHGALTHFLRSGDARWWRLAQDAARHTIDIDIYHTNQDKAAFNHGLFWHTDHYKPAATCTHRTYSRRNGRGRAYGGGPSNEHNYTSGLLLYFYLSGDAEAARAVRELADWVIAMDDGSRNLLGLLDSGPTGLASKTVDFAYHKPGRGAGNSINALLDGYQLLQERPYVAKAEELICRCIHPVDDIDALQLAEPEHRWSYLVFLQVLGKYLDLKVEWGEADYMFHYARDSLLHYAAWMAHNEVPYKDVLHKVELPTETWPAHDVRKAHVLHVAAKYSPLALQSRLHERAAFFFGRCLQDLLSFETAFLTRPLVILCVYGHIHAYFQVHPGVAVEVRAADYSYGRPAVFKPQRARVQLALRSPLRMLAGRVVRGGMSTLGAFRRLVSPPRP